MQRFKSPRNARCLRAERRPLARDTQEQLPVAERVLVQNSDLLGELGGRLLQEIRTQLCPLQTPELWLI